jgi:hypothetical protein
VSNDGLNRREFVKGASVIAATGAALGAARGVSIAAERYESLAMDARNHLYSAAIAAAYTDSQYPLEYYFEVRESPERATLYPGLSDNLTQQPYFVVRRANGG